jgi:hypothetical protein
VKEKMSTSRTRRDMIFLLPLLLLMQLVLSWTDRRAMACKAAKAIGVKNSGESIQSKTGSDKRAEWMVQLRPLIFFSILSPNYNAFLFLSLLSFVTTSNILIHIFIHS